MPKDAPTPAEVMLTDQVVARISPDADPRVQKIMMALIRHVHGFVKDVELTPAEWDKGIAFITDLGAWCSEKRQEVILLSDILGVSMLVDAIAHRHHNPEVTESTVLGPFHRLGAPHVPNGADISGGILGEPLDVRVKVTDPAGAPIAGVQIDVWHTSPDGLYDSQFGDEHALRGVFLTDADGIVHFTSIMPSAYPVPHDGPVGQVLAGMGRGPMRPAHVHFWLRKNGYRPLVTQVFAAGDKYLDDDAVFGVKTSLVHDYKAEAAAAGQAGHKLTWTFVLPQDGV
ncbi:dioxygenase [Humitalea sp. 24SJ18S-53]|uniref:dioxygenase family protein n=1 Tax=Humitalea sp. 24SJ18S-53 TaxID=3422307 RepID=UPI003D676F46